METDLVSWRTAHDTTSYKRAPVPPHRLRLNPPGCIPRPDISHRPQHEVECLTTVWRQILCFVGRSRGGAAIRKRVLYKPAQIRRFINVTITRRLLEDFGKRNMPGKRARRHFSQLSEFERGLIIGMKTAGWSTHRVAGQVDRSKCAVRNCWEQWTREGTHVRKTASGATRKTSRREDRRIVR
ncbi:transposable element Tc1 transposase [Trichonephila clavipes]|nr:transposable element Tc1 transposase [Trichonephila clavipes]